MGATRTSSRVGQAEATRARLLESARTLFVLQGYAGTTTRQIAGHAGVTERTLYNVVASKGDLLRQVLLTYVFGDDPGPLLQRRDFLPVVKAADVDEFVVEFTRWVVSLHTRTSAEAEVTRAAAPVDASAAELWRWGNTQQVIGLRELAGVLAQRGWLRDSLTSDEVAQSLAVLSGHETYWRLVHEERWSKARYRRWLSRHCAAELVAAEASRVR